MGFGQWAVSLPCAYQTPSLRTVIFHAPLPLEGHLSTLHLQSRTTPPCTLKDKHSGSYPPCAL